MRLKDYEIRLIENAVYSLDPDAEIYLFGSRVDNSKKGGDIDLLIMSEKLTFGDKLRIKKRFFEELDEQKIDIVIAKDTGDPFVRMVVKNGIRLQ